MEYGGLFSGIVVELLIKFIRRKNGKEAALPLPPTKNQYDLESFWWFGQTVLKIDILSSTINVIHTSVMDPSSTSITILLVFAYSANPF